MNKFIAGRRLAWLDVALLCALALLLGAYGGPSVYHPDSVLEKALRTLDQGGNPHFFNYPALVLYLNGYLYQGWLGLQGIADPLAWYLAAITPGAVGGLPVFELGQAITLFFSLLGVACTCWAARRLARSRAAGLAAGLLLATCLLWATDAHYLTVDTPMTGLGMAVVALTLVFIPGKGEQREGMRLWQVVLLGVLGGLSAAAKYNGALALLAPALSSFFWYRNKWQWYGHVLLLGAVAGAVFVAANPYIWQDSETFWRDFEYELNHSRLGHPGFTTDQGWLFHLGTTLPLAFGWPALALAAGGTAWLLATRALRWAEKLGLLAFPLAELWVVGGSHLAFQRYALPLLPLVAILAALGLHAFIRAVSQRFPRLGLAAALLAGVALAAAVLPNAAHAVRSDELLAGADTREILDVIVRRVGLDSPSVPGFAGNYTNRYFDLRFMGEQGDANRAAIFVLDSFSHDRWVYDLTTRLTIRRAALAGGQVLQISPYTLPKESVPLAPQSIYSPYLPDLYARDLAGPYIEIYLPDGDLAARLLAACADIGAPCALRAAQEGYYYRQVMK